MSARRTPGVPGILMRSPAPTSTCTGERPSAACREARATSVNAAMPSRAMVGRSSQRCSFSAPERHRPAEGGRWRQVHDPVVQQRMRTQQRRAHLTFTRARPQKERRLVADAIDADRPARNPAARLQGRCRARARAKVAECGFTGQRRPLRRFDRQRQPIGEGDVLERTTDRGGLPTAAPRVQPRRQRVSHGMRQPVADRQAAVCSRDDRPGSQRAAVGVRLPRACESPDAGQAADPRRGEADADSGPVAPPAPASRPDFSLTADARHRDVDLLIGHRFRRKRPPTPPDRAGRPTAPRRRRRRWRSRRLRA